MAKIMPAKPHYLAVTGGPLTLVRVPMAEYPARRSIGGVTWRVFLKSLTPVMHSYGLRAKDITGVYNILPDDSHDPERTAALADAAFAGSAEHFKQFRLWDWRDGRFVLARDAVSC